MKGQGHMSPHAALGRGGLDMAPWCCSWTCASVTSCLSLIAGHWLLLLISYLASE